MIGATAYGRVLRINQMIGLRGFGVFLEDSDLSRKAHQPLNGIHREPRHLCLVAAKGDHSDGHIVGEERIADTVNSLLFSSPWSRFRRGWGEHTSTPGISHQIEGST